MLSSLEIFLNTSLQVDHANPQATNVPFSGLESLFQIMIYPVDKALHTL